MHNSGLYPGSGVSRGGQNGRMRVMHMGVGVQRGGVNTVGSVRRYQPVRPMHQLGVGVVGRKPVKPLRVTGGIGSTPSAVRNPLRVVKPAAPGAPAATPVVGGSDSSSGLDYKNAPDYAAMMGQANADYAQGAAGINEQLGELPAKYDLFHALQQRALTNDRYQSDANLQARGVFQSGSEKQAETDFVNRNAQEENSLSDLYGVNAQARLRAQLAGLEAQRAAGLQGAESAGESWLQQQASLPDASAGAPAKPVVNPLRVVKPVRGSVGLVGSGWGAVPVGKAGVKPVVRKKR